jgi:hypothetical protein
LAYDARWIIVGADGAGAEEEDMARGQGWRGAGGRRRAAEDEAPRETGERTKGRRATKEAAALREKARRANVSSVAELVLRARNCCATFAKPRVHAELRRALASCSSHSSSCASLRHTSVLAATFGRVPR